VFAADFWDVSVIDITITTDKTIYHKWDPQTVYADFTNLGRDIPDGILKLYLVKPFSVSPVQRIFPFDIPAGLDFHEEIYTEENLTFRRPGTYAYLGVLSSLSEGILGYDVAIWGYTTSPSNEEVDQLMQAAERYVRNLR